MAHISDAKQKQLQLRLQELGVVEDDLDEQFIRGSGSGGQKINKTSSCVQLTHRPSGINIRCQRSRSQAMNRYFARRELCDKLDEMRAGAQSRRRQEMEKIRRQKKRRTRLQKERILKAKRVQGEKKQRRSPVRGDE